MTDSKQCIKCSQIKTNDLFDKGRNVCCICRLQQVKTARAAKKVTTVIITSKTCATCNQMKHATEFNKLRNSPDGLDRNCRNCYKVIRHPNRKVITDNNTNIIIRCIKCNIEKSACNFRTNKRSKTGYFKSCIDCYKPSIVTKEKQREYDQRYRAKYPEKLKAKYKKQGQMLHRKIKDRLRARITSALSASNYRKIDKTIEYVGCSIQYLKKWLEFQFSDRISWDNYNMWHIDHVIPCNSFDLSNQEEQAKCFNWSNLRPCLIADNITKGAKIITSLIEKQKQMALEFLKLNPLPSQPGDRVDGTE